MARKKRFCLLGDTHFCYPHLQTIYHFLEFCKDFQPDYIIQMGDLYDCYSQSRFAKKIIDPEWEIKESRKYAEWFWAEAHKVSKKASKIQLLGNHDNRIILRAIDKCPELLPFLKWENAFKFNGVRTIYDTRAEFVLEGINLTHGHRKHGTHMLENMMPTVCAHTHTGGIVYKTFRDNMIWELNVGYAANPESDALAYAPKAYVNWTHGFGAIDEHGPRFIPWDRKKR